MDSRNIIRISVSINLTIDCVLTTDKDTLHFGKQPLNSLQCNENNKNYDKKKKKTFNHSSLKVVNRCAVNHFPLITSCLFFILPQISKTKTPTWGGSPERGRRFHFLFHSMQTSCPHFLPIFSVLPPSIATFDMSLSYFDSPSSIKTLKIASTFARLTQYLFKIVHNFVFIRENFMFINILIFLLRDDKKSHLFSISTSLTNFFLFLNVGEDTSSCRA